MNGARREAILRAAKAVFAEKGLLMAFMSLARQIGGLFLVSFRQGATARGQARKATATHSTGAAAESWGAGSNGGWGEQRWNEPIGGVT